MTKHVRCLKKAITQLESAHKRTTIVSLSGGVISAVGGFASVVGVILAPFTFGASLAVTGVGVTVAAVGGITGVASNVSKVTRKKKCQEKIKGILNDCNRELSPVVAQLHNDNDIVHDCQAMISAGKPIPDLTQVMKLASVGKQASSETIRAVDANGKQPPMTGTRLSMMLDVLSIASDVREVHEIRQRARGRRQSESETLTFINQMEEVAEVLETFC